MNMQEQLALCIKVSRLKKLANIFKWFTSILTYHVRRLDLALSMLKLSFRATFLPIRLALSGIFCIFAAKTSRLFNPFTI